MQKKYKAKIIIGYEKRKNGKEITLVRVEIDELTAIRMCKDFYEGKYNYDFITYWLGNLLASDIGIQIK